MYTITKNQDEFNTIKFVTKAISNNNINPIFNYLWIDGDKKEKNIVCSNGCRLHIAKIPTSFEVGTYEVKITKDIILLTKVEEPGTLYDYNRIIPTKQDMVLAYEKCNKKTPLEFILYGVINNLNEQIINHEYIKDVLSNDFTFTCYTSGDLKPVVFECDNLKAIIMPIDMRKKVEGKHVLRETVRDIHKEIAEEYHKFNGEISLKQITEAFTYSGIEI